MSEAKRGRERGLIGAGHTPGPWRAEIGEIDARYLRGIGPVALIRRTAADDDRYVAFASLDAMGFDSEVRTSQAERDANARLIASAPGLLAALKDAGDFLAAHFASFDGSRWENAEAKEVADKIDAIVAKAEGRRDARRGLSASDGN